MTWSPSLGRPGQNYLWTLNFYFAVRIRLWNISPSVRCLASKLSANRVNYFYIYLFQKKSLLKSLCKHSTSTASSTSFCCWQMAHWLLAYDESLFNLFYHRIFTFSFGDQILVHGICNIYPMLHITCITYYMWHFLL